MHHDTDISINGFNALCMNNRVHCVVLHTQRFSDAGVLKCLVLFVCRNVLIAMGLGKKTRLDCLLCSVEYVSHRFFYQMVAKETV